MEVGAFKDIEARQDAFKALQTNEYIDLKYKVNKPQGKPPGLLANSAQDHKGRKEK